MPTRVMNKSGVEAGGCVHGMPGIDQIYGGDQRFVKGKKVVFADISGEEGRKGFLKNSSIKEASCSDELSSIGKNSDLSVNSLEKSGDDEEVQSTYKEPLDAMESLEEVLPMRRGISRFYNGKSKSFASLADASSSSSIKDIAKPDNMYARKRRSRNLLACNVTWDRTRSSPLRGNGGGTLKRATNASRTTLALALAMSNSDGDKQAGECSSVGSLSVCPRKDLSTWRSFSLADLQQCASVAFTCSNPNELPTKLNR